MNPILYLAFPAIAFEITLLLQKGKTCIVYNMIFKKQGIWAKTLFVAAGLCLIAQALSSQETLSAQAVPNALRLPEMGEAPRYPEDMVIGKLGQGESPEGAYFLARNIVSSISAGSRNTPLLTDSGHLLSESLFEEIRSIRPRNYRLGGGRTEPDGCVSFIVRFIGQTESITGELFVRWVSASESADQEMGRWVFDDLVIEDKRALSEIKDNYRYDFSPYERFY
jgi:hypothetical protein